MRDREYYTKWDTNDDSTHAIALKEELEHAIEENNYFKARIGELEQRLVELVEENRRLERELELSSLTPPQQEDMMCDVMNMLIR